MNEVSIPYVGLYVVYDSEVKRTNQPLKSVDDRVLMLHEFKKCYSG